MQKAKPMWWNIFRGIIAAAIVVSVSECSAKYPRIGALLLTLPIISIVAFAMTWMQHHEIGGISRLSKETLVLVPLGLPMFVPLAFAERLGLGFWTAFVFGIALASFAIVLWFWLGPKTL
jgi:hypothetical protein